MHKLLLKIAKNPFDSHTTLILSNDSHTYTLQCNTQAWSVPFQGKQLSVTEIEDLIEFLKLTLEGNNGKGDLARPS
ncbi:MAG TPA: hypothetical protein VK590_09160 [Saprospiraceae bacterium]|nr:hypothetical protein [Saprospiraceae bacterium]